MMCLIGRDEKDMRYGDEEENNREIQREKETA